MRGSSWFTESGLQITLAEKAQRWRWVAAVTAGACLYLGRLGSKARLGSRMWLSTTSPAPLRTTSSTEVPPLKSTKTSQNSTASPGLIIQTCVSKGTFHTQIIRKDRVEN